MSKFAMVFCVLFGMYALGALTSQAIVGGRDRRQLAAARDSLRAATSDAQMIRIARAYHVPLTFAARTGPIPERFGKSPDAFHVNGGMLLLMNGHWTFTDADGQHWNLDDFGPVHVEGPQ